MSEDIELDKTTAEGEVSPEDFVASPTGGKVETPELVDETAEFKLTPEIEAQIMEKVQDINKYGTAFSAIKNGDDKLSSVLQYGLIGTSKKQPHINRSGFCNENSPALCKCSKKP